MDFAYSARCDELRETLLAFMEERVYPAEPVHEAQVAEAANPWDATPVMADLKAEARSRGLWNLFHPEERWGAGLSNTD